MNKVFVVGAGFSKALANAPLANELFERIYQKAQIPDEKDRLGAQGLLWVFSGVQTGQIGNRIDRRHK